MVLGRAVRTVITDRQQVVSETHELLVKLGDRELRTSANNIICSRILGRDSSDVEQQQLQATVS